MPSPPPPDRFPASLICRDASPRDAAVVAEVYAHHVLNGTASFDTEPPPVDFWTAKIETIRERGWPFRVAESDRVVIGYAYASQFRDRPAYARTCEDSVYVDHRHVGKGVGTALLGDLIDQARQAGFEQMIAVIGGAEPASVALHAGCGFVEVGRMRRVGHKFGRVLDTLYMQRDLTGD